MSFFPSSLENLIDAFASLPGIGKKSAQRLAFHVLSLPEGGRGQVVSVGYEMADGIPFVGVGIEPDVPCPPRAEDVQTGWDRTLDLALDQLA